MEKFGPLDPSWGALLVKNDELLSAVYYESGENKDAVARLAEKYSKNVTSEVGPAYCLYLSLEPTSIYGRLPPVTESVRKLGVKRVVIGALSPLPKQRGEGIKILESFVPEVLVMDGEEALFAQELLVDFEKWLHTGLPSLVAFGSCRKIDSAWEIVLDKDSPLSSPPSDLAEAKFKKWALEKQILRAAVKDLAQIPSLLKEQLLDRIYLHKGDWSEHDFQALAQAEFQMAGQKVCIDQLHLSRTHPDFLEAKLRLC